MVNIIILSTIIVLISFWYIIGNAIEVTLKKDLTHKTIMGFFFYFTCYGFISIPIAVLHVSWSLFFIIISLYNIILLGVALALLYQNRAEIKISKVKIIEWIKKNIVVICLIGLYFLIYLMSDYSLFWHVNRGAIWDHSYYASKANAAIGSSHILMINPKYGYVESPMAILVNSTITWELFWSYISSITHLTINQVSKLVMPLIIYIVVFFTYDMVFQKMFKRRNQIFYQGYALLFLLYLIYTTAYDGLQDDVSKFMYYPWYGNVLVTMLFIPLTVYLSYKALKNMKYLILLFLQVIFFNVFSAGGVMYAALLYPIFIIYWKMFKEYKFKYENIFTYLSLCLLLGLNLMYVFSQKDVPWIEQDRWLEYFNIFIPVFLFSSFGVLLLFYKHYIQKTEKYIIIIFLAMLLFLVLEPVSGFLFQQYKFALHRFALSIMIVYTIIGLTGYVEVLKGNTKIFIVGMIPFLLVAQKNYDFFLLKNKGELQISNILNTDRESSEVLEVSHFLNAKQQEVKKPIYYCAYGADAYQYNDKRFRTKYYGAYIDIGSMLITETKDVYEVHLQNENFNRDLTVDELLTSNCQYLITDVEAFVNYAEKQGATEVKTIKSERLLNEVKIIDLNPINREEKFDATVKI